MLKLLRHKKTAKRIWIGLAILILPAFLFWGMGSALRNKEGPAYAGTVFGRKVSLLEYKEAMAAVRNAAIIRFGPDLDEARKHIDMERQAWERIALLAVAKKRGIRATDAEVVSAVEGFPFFQRNGLFQEKLYADSLRYSFRTQAREFEEQTRQNIILAKLYTQIVSKIKLTDQEIQKEYRKLNQEISLSYIAALPLAFIKDMRPTEAEIEEYYNKNKLEFKQPSSFNLEYMVLDSEEKARNTLALLRKSKDFAAVAKEAGGTIKETGVFTQEETIPEIGWQPQIIEMASKTEVGHFLRPLKIDTQFFIFRLKEKKEASIPAFASVKEKVRDAYLKAAGRKLAQEKIEACLKRLNEPAGAGSKAAEFAKIGTQSGLKYGETAPFVFGTYIEGIGASDELWLEADKLKDNETSPVIALQTGFFIIRLKSKSAFDEKKFEKEKPEFAKKILLQKEEEAFTSFLEELFKKTQ